MMQVANVMRAARAFAAASALLFAACVASPREAGFVARGEPVLFAPGVVSTRYSDVRLTISPDGQNALWFSRDRPGGPGGYDIWISNRVADGWTEPRPVSFNSAGRDFDPAFSADGRFVYFCSDRAGGSGGDDLYRVRVLTQGFGAPENLGAHVNTPRNEWAPMMSPDGRTLLFSSDGYGATRMDLITSRVVDGQLTPAGRLPGELNTSQDEFDATFLADGRTVIFTRAANLATNRVRLFHSSLRRGRYGVGAELPEGINVPGSDTYAPMLDWSQRDRLTFTRRLTNSPDGADLHVVPFHMW